MSKSFFFIYLCYNEYGDIMKDIVYINEELNTKFNFRVGGIIVDNDQLLLQHTEGDDYYALVGGRVDFNEDTQTSLIREIKEELGFSINKEDTMLIDVVENFFDLKGYSFHELLFIYRVDVSKYNYDKEPIKTIDKKNSVNSWFSFDEVSNMNLQPALAKELLNSKELRHTINRENKND